MAGPLLDLDEVDADMLDSDDDFAGRGLWVGSLLESEHVWTAELMDANGSHMCPLPLRTVVSVQEPTT